MQNSSINRPKRLLIRRLQSVRAVCWSLDTFGGRLKPGQREFIAGLRQRLGSARDGLKLTERHLGRSERRRAQRLRRRNRAKKQLRAAMVAWRGVCTHAFGDEQLAEIGFARRVEEAPEALLEQAVMVTSTVGEADFTAPSPVVKSLSVDWPGLVVELKTLADALSAALNEWRDAQCDVTLALHDRNQKLDVFNRDFLHIARIVEALLRRAGFDSLADKVRPSTRRPGVTQEPFLAGDEATPGADSNGADSEQNTSLQSAHDGVSLVQKTLLGVRPREPDPGAAGRKEVEKVHGSVAEPDAVQRTH
jgi:hypothetical protein